MTATPATLRAARLDAGLTLREIGERIKRTPQRVHQVETGRCYHPIIADRVMRAISEIRSDRP